MKLSKLIVPTTLFAIVALYAPHAGAQTMGEYAATTASVGSSASSAGTDLGGSSTWGASSVGASFAERAGAISGSSLGQDFESRAGSGSSAESSESRWPNSQLNQAASDRFNDTGDRFGTADRFTERNQLSDSGARFPESRFNDNRQGLDNHYDSSSGLDKSYSSSSELDSSHTSQP